MRRSVNATAIILGFAIAAFGRAGTIHVYQSDSIQAALNLAVGGDEIVVHPRTYNELIDPHGRAVWLHSSDGPTATTIDGKQTGTIINCFTGEGPDTILEGFTITGGVGQPNGGGMFVYSCGPTARGCVFRENRADYGGGMFVHFGHPTPVECTFTDNVADESGGGVYSFNQPGQPSATIRECVFDGNEARTVGGGMRNWDSKPTLTGCLVRGNHARLHGAGVANGGGETDALFSNCAFVGNRADTLFANWDSYGGGMANTDGSNPVLVNCVFVANSAVAMLPALSHGGALACFDSAGPMLINCTLSGNHANLGNALYNANNSNPAVLSSILWDGGDEIFNDGPASVTVAYSAVEGYWPGPGNIADDPRLSELRLQPDSPCINAPDPDYDPPGATELDGHARVLCGRVDMGAYEFGVGDYDRDRDVDAEDLVGGAVCMTGPLNGPYAAGCEALDIEYDLGVDLADYAQLQRLLGD